MRGLGLSELWVLGGTSDAGDRCPTQFVSSNSNRDMVLILYLKLWMQHRRLYRQNFKIL